MRLLFVYWAVSKRNQTEYRVKLYRDLDDQIIESLLSVKCTRKRTQNTKQNPEQNLWICLVVKAIFLLEWNVRKAIVDTEIMES